MFMTVWSDVCKAAEDPEEYGARVSWISGRPKLTEYSTMVIKSTRAFQNMYMNLLHSNSCKPTTCFCHPLWPSSWRCFYEGYITKTTTPMYKYIILRFKYLYIKYFWFYSDNEASVHGHEIFQICGILKYAVGYFLLDSVLVTESSITDCCFESWNNSSNNYKVAPTVSMLLTTCLDQTAQYTLSPKIKKGQIFTSWKQIGFTFHKKNP